MDSKTSQEASSGSRGPRKLKCTHCTERHWKCRRQMSDRYLAVPCPGIPTGDDFSLPSPTAAARIREPGKRLAGSLTSGASSARAGNETTETALPRTEDAGWRGSQKRHRTLRPKGPFITSRFYPEGSYVTSRFQLLGPGGDEECATADRPKINARQLPMPETEVGFPDGPSASKRPRRAEDSIDAGSVPSSALGRRVLISVDTVPDNMSESLVQLRAEIPRPNTATDSAVTRSLDVDFRADDSGGARRALDPADAPAQVASDPG